MTSDLVSYLWTPFKKTGYVRIFSWQYIDTSTCCSYIWTSWNHPWIVPSCIQSVLCGVCAEPKSAKKWSIFYSFSCNHGNSMATYMTQHQMFWLLWTASPKTFWTIYDMTPIWYYSPSRNPISRCCALSGARFSQSPLPPKWIRGLYP